VSSTEIGAKCSRVFKCFHTYNLCDCGPENLGSILKQLDVRGHISYEIVCFISIEKFSPEFVQAF
jgi:hypothetical protein